MPVRFMPMVSPELLRQAGPLSQGQLYGITATQLRAFAPTDIANLSTTEIRGLNSQQISHVKIELFKKSRNRCTSCSKLCTKGLP